MSNENKSIIKAINMFGRVPEQWELLEEIERLNNIINEFEKWLEEQLMYFNDNNKEGGFSTNVEDLEIVKEKLQELKGSDSNE